jgi:hypothetical protein
VCLGGSHLRLLLSSVEDHERLALANRLAGVEQDLIDDPGQVRADRDAAYRGHRPDRVERGRPLLLRRHDRRHRLGGRLVRRPLCDGCLDLLELHKAQPPTEQIASGSASRTSV